VNRAKEKRVGEQGLKLLEGEKSKLEDKIRSEGSNRDRMKRKPKKKEGEVTRPEGMFTSFSPHSSLENYDGKKENFRPQNEI